MRVFEHVDASVVLLGGWWVHTPENLYDARKSKIPSPAQEKIGRFFESPKTQNELAADVKRKNQKRFPNNVAERESSDTCVQKVL